MVAAAWCSLAVPCDRDLRGGSEPVVNHKVVGQGMPERDRLGLDQAGHGQSIKAAVLVRGVDALDQFAPAEERLAVLGLHSGAPGARHFRKGCTYSCRTACRGPECQPQAGRAGDAPAWHPGSRAAWLSCVHHRQQAFSAGRGHLLDRNFVAEKPDQSLPRQRPGSGWRISPISRPARAGSTWP